MGVAVLFFGSRGMTATESLRQEELHLLLQRLRAENADLKAQLELREAVIRNLQQSLAVARTECELFQRKWAEAQARAQTLGANPSDPEAVAAQRQLLETVRQLAQAQAERQRLLEQLQRLLHAVQSNTNVQAEAAAAEATLSALRQSGTTLSQPAAATPEAAQVLDVNPKLRVAVLNVGAEQGVRVGMPLQVLRGQRVIAGLRVVEVRARVSGALIETVPKGVLVRSGDVVRVTQGVKVTPP